MNRYPITDFPERCSRHHAPMVQATKSSPLVCLVEWLVQRAGGAQVVDLVLHDEDLPMVILANGMALPISLALDLNTGQEVPPTLEDVDGKYVADITYAPPRNGQTEALSVELLPKGARVNVERGIFLLLDMEALLYMLFEEEFRRAEP